MRQGAGTRGTVALGIERARHTQTCYNFLILKVLEDALGKVLRLPEDKQELAAELLELLEQLEQLAQSDSEPYPLSPDERRTVREALARAERGEFGDEADVDATLRRPWA